MIAAGLLVACGTSHRATLRIFGDIPERWPSRGSDSLSLALIHAFSGAVAGPIVREPLTRPFLVPDAAPRSRDGQRKLLLKPTMSGGINSAMLSIRAYDRRLAGDRRAAAALTQRG